MLRRPYEVARLCRPDRIRCYPISCPLFSINLINRNNHRRHAASSAAAVTSANEDPEEFVPPTYTRRNELTDHQEAVEIAKAATRSGSGNRKKAGSSKLPSLLDQASFRNAGARSTPIAQSSKSSASTASVSGGDIPASTIRKPSKKGKEKAVDQELPSDSRNPDVQEISSSTASSTSKNTLNRNPVGVQLLSSSLHSQLFPAPPLPKPPEELTQISRSHLTENGLSPDGAAILPELSFNMPSLQGSNIREHFLSLGEITGEPYLSLSKSFINIDLPPIPTSWDLSTPGWKRYGSDGSITLVNDLTGEQMISFDVETLYKLSPYPVIATAASPEAWYSWISPTIFDQPPDVIPPNPLPWEDRIVKHHPHDLIPLFNKEDDNARIVIGHNVGYDRARVLEEYDLKRTSTRWIDTLSLHASTRGITSVQRPAWMKFRKNKKEKTLREAETLAYLTEQAEESGDSSLLEAIASYGHDGSSDGDVEAIQKRWEDVCSMNSLAEVASLHCGIPVDKSIRDTFGDASITHASQLQGNLSQLMTYCANDTKVTHQVYKKVLPLFFESCPHPASFAGVLSMGNSFLPVNESWKEYLKNAEEKYREMDEGVKKALWLLAEKTRKEGKKEGDPWSEQLDWSEKNARWSEEQLVSVNPESDSGHSTPTEGSSSTSTVTSSTTASTASTIPVWLAPILADKSYLTTIKAQRNLLPLILRMSYKSHPVVFLSDHYWCFKVPHDRLCEYIETHGPPLELSPKDKFLHKYSADYVFFRIGESYSEKNKSRKVKLSGASVKSLINRGELSSPYTELLRKVTKSNLDDLQDEISKAAEDLVKMGKGNDWSDQLDWTLVNPKTPQPSSSISEANPEAKQGTESAEASIVKPKPKSKSRVGAYGTWPKWYWDLTGPINEKNPIGELDLTTKKTVAPLLLRLQWQGYPLFYSKENKWLCRIPNKELSAAERSGKSPRGSSVDFYSSGEQNELTTGYSFFRLPHKDGEGKNVGNPLSKSFVRYIESGELASLAAEDGGDDIARKAASDATNMSVLCSYWMSSRERIMEQMVVYKDNDPTAGMILPQVITMGTVTRRAVEATWLTASNAKKNRVGSELKAMVRAPPGYAIVGADVDSEELWISSVMGDSQFGMHGSTAIGWMTLEGTKSAGTDLHSKTASILGISRDAAKVFNYSRIYGAGQKHAVQLLLQGDPTLSKEIAEKRAKDLYKATKGDKTKRNSRLAPAKIPTLWHGGSESYLFNTLEAIALSDRPTTPALGCGVTKALRRSYLEEGSSYLPSRVNWVVQSSGVDYLHLLIVSMEYLIKKYEISARYLISVHDEVRYLATDNDRYRTALALQIANAWTRALFCYNLGIDNMPQGIAFFSAVDVDHVLRKEVFMTCETPSHPNPIPAGESLDIKQVLELTGGSLGEPVHVDGKMKGKAGIDDSGPPVKLFPDITSFQHRQFLEGQASKKGTKCRNWLDSQPIIPGLEDIGVDDLVDNAEKFKPRKAVAMKKRYIKVKGGDIVDEYQDYHGAHDDGDFDWQAIGVPEFGGVSKSTGSTSRVKRKVAVASKSRSQSK